MEIMKPKKIRTTKLNIRIRMTMRTKGIILTQRSNIRILRIKYSDLKEKDQKEKDQKETRNQNNTKPEPDQKEHMNQNK